MKNLIVLLVLLGIAAAVPAFVFSEEKETKAPLEIARPDVPAHEITKRLQPDELLHFGNILLTSKERKIASACFYAHLEKSPGDGVTMYNLACAHSLMNQSDAAFYWLQESAKLGAVNAKWARQDTDFASIKSDERFEKILKFNEEIAGKPGEKDADLIFAPKRKAKEGEKFPVLVWLHGRGNKPQTVCPTLKVFADRHDIVIVAPHGPDKYGEIGYTWDSGFDATKKRIDEALAKAEKKFPVDKDRLIVSGFSQGARMALQMQIKHAKRVRGSIVFCPMGIPAKDLSKEIEGRVILVVMESGIPHEKRRKAQKEYTEKGATMLIHSVSGMGHTIPKEHQTYMESWLLLILDRIQAGGK